MKRYNLCNFQDDIGSSSKTYDLTKKIFCKVFTGLSIHKTIFLHNLMTSNVIFAKKNSNLISNAIFTIKNSNFQIQYLPKRIQITSTSIFVTWNSNLSLNSIFAKKNSNRFKFNICQKEFKFDLKCKVC